MRILKQYIALVLALLIVFNSIGFILSFDLIRHDWQQKVKENLIEWTDEENLARFTFAATDSRTKDDEFSIEGKFFDVVRRETVGDSVVIYCYFDENESRLNASFNENIQSISTENTDFQEKSKHLWGFLLKEFDFNLEKIILFPPSVFLKKNTISTSLTFFYSSPFKGLIFPPPQV